MSYKDYSIKRYCEKTKLRIYHTKPKLRLYVPFTTSTKLHNAEGETINIKIDNNDITNNVYYVQNEAQTAGRYIINARAVEQYKLLPNFEYVFCVDKKIQSITMYRYEYYFSYDKENENSTNNRQFNVSFYSTELLDFDEIEHRANDAIIEALGEDYFDLVIGINNGIAIARYLGYEEIPAVEWELDKNTQLNYPYIIIDLNEHYRPYVWCNITTKTYAELMSYKDSIITVDFDGLELATVESTIGMFLYLHKDLAYREIKIYQTKHGFHAIIFLSRLYEFKQIIEWRKELQDDEHRIDIDMYKWELGECSRPAVNTLFKQKWEYHHGTYTLISYETLIRTIKH